MEIKDFGEAKQQKGFFIYDTIKNTAKFVKLNTRQFFDIKLSYVPSNDLLEKIIKDIEMYDITNSIVRVTISGPPEVINKIDKDIIMLALNKYNMYSFTMSLISVTDKQARNKNITDDLDDEKAFNIYMSSNFIGKDDLVYKYGLDIVRENKE